ncbi:serine/threonine-protein kinase [Nonomuraea sp. NPDC049309]|uniref:serine/threonine-protein kinase n=1 Tax=Nonomuraea sp. NPDC049309 TaxID=3364350 RepID=UPI00371EB4EC
MSELRADDPRQLGSYRLTRRLGQGGQGVVYLGESPHGQQVAIKLLHASLSGTPDARRRFLSEIEAVRRVAAFCTAQLLDADLEGDRPYLVSEYVEGPSLREHVETEGPRTGGALERLAIGTATALGAIHRAGVVHRDFKPGNVLLGIDGPRVIDFGVSRLVGTAVTTSHMPLGTPAYMAPERMKGEPAGPPADMWAWALTVAYTANGRHAYTAETHNEILARVLYGKPDLGDLDGRLREIVEACLAVEPADRPDAEEVLRLLLGQEAVAGGDVLTTGAMAAVGGKALGTLVRPATAVTRAPGAVVGIGASEAEPGVITDPDPTTSFPAITPGQVAEAAAGDRRRRVRPWQVAVVIAGVLVGVTGLLLYLRGAQGPGLAGDWTGSAEHFTAGRVFPVELVLDHDGAGRMRWGADLHCTGRLVPEDGGMVFTLRDVTGRECYPGTLRMFPTSDVNQMDIKVSRPGKDEVTYSGRVARTS